MRNYVLAAAVALGVTLPIVPAYADVKAGVKAWAQGKFEDAVAHWRIPAQTGDADAQFNLGQAYRFGRGVPMDLNMAENWYRRAARLGHVRAEENLGLVLFQKGNYDEAFPLLEKAAKREDPRAQYVLGTALFNGDLIEKDWARAYALMLRASANGLGRATTHLTGEVAHAPAMPPATPPAPRGPDLLPPLPSPPVEMQTAAKYGACRQWPRH
ncbi:MAG: tetratricopeptide repeat protein [Sphingomonadaceae bacterium]|jgi:TPR repeat protein